MTLLRRLKFQGIRIQWRVCPQLLPENQWQNKYVESTRVLCLDGGSSPPISTKKAAFAAFFVEMGGLMSAPVSDPIPPPFPQERELVEMLRGEGSGQSSMVNRIPTWKSKVFR